MPISGGSSLTALAVWDVLKAAIVTADSIGEDLQKTDSLVDDIQGVDVSGDVTDFALILDNDLATRPVWDTINEYAELTFPIPVTIKEIRVRGKGTNNEDGRFKLEAYLETEWNDMLIGIPTVLGVWGAWTPVTTVGTSARWRFTCTTVDTGDNLSMAEIELLGVPA